MSYPQFFLDEQVLGDEQEAVIPLARSADDMKHAKALRLRAGETIAVIDAASDYFVCEIVDASKQGISVRISSREPNKVAALPRIRLFQGLGKGDRFEDVLRHATEIGVDEFVPLVSERTVVRLDEPRTASKLARWRSIVKSAAMQSGRRSVPAVSEPCRFTDLGKLMVDDVAVILFWEESDGGMTLHEALASVRDAEEQEALRVSVIIGPEGGFSEGEVSSLAGAGNVRVMSLGDTILRTETAGLIGPALVLYELGGLGSSASQQDRNA